MLKKKLEEFDANAMAGSVMEYVFSLAVCDVNIGTVFQQ